MTDTLTISEARAQLPSLVEKISQHLDRVVITVHGKPKAVVLSPEELESLEETVKVESIPGAKQSIRKGFREAQKGLGIPLKQLLK